jgi:hypothetical protein
LFLLSIYNLVHEGVKCPRDVGMKEKTVPGLLLIL